MRTGRGGVRMGVGVLGVGVRMLCALVCWCMRWCAGTCAWVHGRACVRMHVWMDGCMDVGR